MWQMMPIDSTFTMNITLSACSFVNPSHSCTPCRNKMKETVEMDVEGLNDTHYYPSGNERERCGREFERSMTVVIQK
jgi:hypothetical protein